MIKDGVYKCKMKYSILIKGESYKLTYRPYGYDPIEVYTMNGLSLGHCSESQANEWFNTSPRKRSGRTTFKEWCQK